MTDQEGAAMTPDIVTEARRWVGRLRDRANRPTLEFAHLERPQVDCRCRCTDLVAEVERLRHELDQRTDPELAARLVKHADTAMRDSTTVHGYYVSLSDDLLDAARLLGGDQ